MNARSVTPEPAAGDPEAREVAILSSHRVRRQAQILRQQLTDLMTRLDGSVAPTPIEDAMLEDMNRKLQGLQADLRRLVEGLRRIERPIEETTFLATVVEAVLGDTTALIAVLDGLRSQQYTPR